MQSTRSSNNKQKKYVMKSFMNVRNRIYGNFSVQIWGRGQGSESPEVIKMSIQTVN